MLSLFQPQHRCRCTTLEDMLRRGRGSSSKNAFVVLNVVQIQQPLNEPRTTASCGTWFRSTAENSPPMRVLHNCAITIRSRWCHRCSYNESDTPTRDLTVGDTFQDRRQPGHQDAAPAGSPTVYHPLRSSQPVPPGDPPDDTPLPNCSDKQLLDDLRRASAMALLRCIVSRYATAWAESLEGAISGHQSWAVLCRRHRRLLLAEVLGDSDRNAGHQ